MSYIVILKYEYSDFLVMMHEVYWCILLFCYDLFAVFFPEVGGSTLDSHHGFVVEYGIDRDVDLGQCSLQSFHLVYI